MTDEIIRLRQEGWPFARIGAALGLTEDQARGRYRRAAKRPPEAPQPPEGPTLEELSREEREKEKRAHQDRLFKELLSEKSQTDAILEAILAAIPRVPAARIHRLPIPKLDTTEQTALLLLSDLHVGAVADREETGGFGEYNYQIFRARLHGLRDAVRSITRHHQQAGPVEQLVVASLGDLIENDEIFPAQGSMIDLDLTEQFLATIEDLAEFLLGLLDTFETIFVPSVTGNHGRIGKKGQRKRHINWDYLIAHMLKAKLANHERIVIEAPKAPFMVVDIQGFQFLLRHGDGIKSWGGIPWYGIQRSTGRWIAVQAAAGKHFDYMVMGHFHTPAHIPFTGGEVLVNGCFPGTTEFSVEVLESLTTPMQFFGLVHPRYGLAARYPILLDRERGLRVA